MNKHIHKYIRIRIGIKRREEYKCSLPGCTHHTFPELVVGRESICNYCGNIFYMNKASVRLSKPHCGCLSKKSGSVKTIEDFLLDKL